MARISGRPAEERVREKKSLGEILVLAHASVYAQTGTTVFVLIDESDGRQRAEQEKRWLTSRAAPGKLHLWSTPQVLREAARHPDWIKGGLTWEQVYDQMTDYDDGLKRRRPKVP